MNSFRYLLLLFYILSIFLCGLYAKGKSSKPNIIIFFYDDPGGTIKRAEENKNLVTQLASLAERNKEQPFLVYVPYAMSHAPIHSGKAFAGKSLRGTYGDRVEEMDWSAAEIMKTLIDEQPNCAKVLLKIKRVFIEI